VYQATVVKLGGVAQEAIMMGELRSDGSEKESWYGWRRLRKRREGTSDKDKKMRSGKHARTARFGGGKAEDRQPDTLTLTHRQRQTNIEGGFWCSNIFQSAGLHRRTTLCRREAASIAM